MRMADDDMSNVAGIFQDRAQAERALSDLRAAGVEPHRVSVIAKDPSGAADVSRDAGTDAATGTAAGVGVGTILGGAAGWLVGIGALAIPGIGPVVAAGPIAAALGVAGTTAAVGAGAGAVAGGLVGALTGWGFSEAQAREYESRIAQGDILLAVRVPQHELELAEDILRRDGGDRVSGRLAA